MHTESVALYLRLSREDDERRSESESIKNQRAFLTEFAEKMGWRIYGIYIDDGYSGTNFDRPDFNRLISDTEKGKINTVITKDLSRLGRDYIQTGYYLEKYFPSMGVRFIAVNDGIDTLNEENGNNDMSPFKSVINDMYARDISKKVRTALTTKKKIGKFIGSFAPFGYKKDPNDRGHLIIDEETAPIVRKIYKLFLEGTSLIGIAKILTEEKIPTPSLTKHRLPVQKPFKGQWNDIIIRRILTTETYIGNLTQNRSRKINYKVDKKISLEKKDWIVIKNTHEGIISKNDFEAVQRIMASKSYVRKNSSKDMHLLSGIVFCGDCGAPMTFIRESPERTYLTCSAWKKYGKSGLCTSHCIREDYVEKVLRDNLKGLVQSIDIEDIIIHVINENSHKDAYLKELNILINKSHFCKDACINLYKDKLSGILTDEQFIDMRQKFMEEEKEVNIKIESLRQKIETFKDSEQMKTRIMQFLEFSKLDRNVLLLLISRITVLKDKKIQIAFNFKNPL